MLYCFLIPHYIDVTALNTKMSAWKLHPIHKNYLQCPSVVTASAAFKVHRAELEAPSCCYNLDTLRNLRPLQGKG